MDDRFKRRPGTSRLNPGTSKLPQRPPASPQERPVVVRLDPKAKTGEFNFVIEGDEELTGKVPQSGLVADSEGVIPPQLYKAVDEVLGFIYQLDQQFENGRKPRKR